MGTIGSSRKVNAVPAVYLWWILVVGVGLLPPFLHVNAAPNSVRALSSSNSFAAGCLHNALGDNYPRRICNSDDGTSSDNATLCSTSRFDYAEIRVHNSNWESSIFYAWIIQILLSELLEVPVTIESIGADNGIASFYHPDNAMPYSDEGYPYDAVKQAHEIGDCRQNTEVPCAHILPEVWSEKNAGWRVAQDEGYIDAVRGNGMVGKISWYIPRSLAERDPTLVSRYGMSGNENRQKLADTFGRPTTWLEWCRDISPTNCSAYDGTALRWPLNGTSEGSKYFVEGIYKGHFRFTDENNCTMNPDTCTGHIVDGPCSWGSYTEAQTYWDEIALKSNGPLEPFGGYPYGAMVEIWEAANATQSDVVMWWWRPESVVEAFKNSAYEFQPVALVTPTDECAKTRVKNFCSADWEDRVGEREGACDYEASALKMVVSASLKTNTYRVPEAMRSPGYDAIMALQVSELSMNSILREWNRLNRTGHGGREAVCNWVANNIEELDKLVVPRGYPREVSEGIYNIAFLQVARVLAALTTAAVLMTGVATYYWRDSRVMIYAQFDFLMLILLGFLLISAGAINATIKPSAASCIAQPWLVMPGYTLAIVPILVKVAAINKLVHEATRMRRVQLSRKRLFGAVALMVDLILVYLIIWTAVDTPASNEEWAIVSEGSTKVEVGLQCSSSSDIWISIGFAWIFLLLLCATVLAWQNRDTRQEFNESRRLLFATYSHFVFLVLQLITFLIPSTSIPAQYRAGTESLLLSLDTMVSIVIYFVPKFMSAAQKARETNLQEMNVISNRSWSTHSQSAPVSERSDYGISERIQSQPALVSETSVNGINEITQDLPQQDKFHY